MMPKQRGSIREVTGGLLDLCLLLSEEAREGHDVDVDLWDLAIAFMCRTHCERPYDRLLRWDVEKRIWDKVALPQIGYEFRLGHDSKRCGNAPQNTKTVVVIHEHGIMDLPIVFCACRDAGSEVEQLMRAGLWPATWDRPQTATTWTALEAFHSLNLNGQMNVHDYLAHLKRHTDNVCAEDVKVRISILLVCAASDGF